LLVGINAYPGQPLNGCVNDVTDMAKFLVAKCGFESDDIRLLVDSRATTDGIKERLGWLLAGVEPGDRVFFHYSGHGALFPMRNAQGQVSGTYDTICPVDFDWSREHAILSTDFEHIFSTVPSGTEFIFVSDSCNSGDLSKAMRNYSVKFLFPPADIEWRLNTAAAKKMQPYSIRSALHNNCAFISGCRSDQESADAVFSGRPNGALTYYLLDSLNAPEGLSQSLARLVPIVRQKLQANHYSQQPQLHGPDTLVTRAFLSRAQRTATHVPARKAATRARRRK
jgi:hypothetical protein